MFYFIYFIINIIGFTGCSSFLITSTIFFSSHISNFSFLLSSHCSPSPSLWSILNFYFPHFSISIFICSQFLLSVLNFNCPSLLNLYFPLCSILFSFYSQFFSPSLLNFVTLVSFLVRYRCRFRSIEEGNSVNRSHSQKSLYCFCRDDAAVS